MIRLKDNRILLRPPEPGDVNCIYDWENESSLWQVSQTLAPYSKFAIEQYILNARQQDLFASRELRLMIEKTEPLETIGILDLFEIDPLNRRAGIGILIADRERNRGFASHALNLILPYAFKHLGLHQLYCNIGCTNETSLALFRKFGFETCGVKKEWNRNGDNWEDEYLLQLIHK